MKMAYPDPAPILGEWKMKWKLQGLQGLYTVYVGDIGIMENKMETTS